MREGLNEGFKFNNPNAKATCGCGESVRGLSQRSRPMALLQIAEPGRAAAPHQHRLAVGIDLGTTNSLVATRAQRACRTVLADEAGPRCCCRRWCTTASDGVAASATRRARARRDDPRNTIASVKRLIGRALADVARRHLPYARARRCRDSAVGVRTRAGLKSPVDIGAEVLRALRERAEAALGGALVGAVITVPAYFDDAQRQATKDAARAGRPERAAPAERTDRRGRGLRAGPGREGVYVVYDLGGGTFDVSILRLTRGVFEVIATSGDSVLGGDDFDHAWPPGSAARHRRRLGRAGHRRAARRGARRQGGADRRRPR